MLQNQPLESRNAGLHLAAATDVAASGDAGENVWLGGLESERRLSDRYISAFANCRPTLKAKSSSISF